MGKLKYLECEIQMPLTKLPVRSTYVDLGTAKILFSPGSKLTTSQLQLVGEITDMVVPNYLHSGGINQARSIFPNAKIWGVKGIEKLKPEIPWTNLLSKETWLFHEEMPLIEVRGVPKVKECVFIHKESKTLLVTDLVFNLLHAKGASAWLVFSAFGTFRRFAVSRLYTMTIKDSTAFTESMRNILQHDFDRIVMSHGDIVETGGKDLLRRALKERGFAV